MKKYIPVIVLLLCALWLSTPTTARADEPVHTITVTANINVAEIGCMWADILTEDYYIACTDCISATCVYTSQWDTVGVFVEPDGVIDTWSYTTTVSETFTGFYSWSTTVFWSGYDYSGPNYITYTLSLVPPTPTPTPTPTLTPTPTPTLAPNEYSEDYLLISYPNRVYLPIIFGGSGGGSPPETGLNTDMTWWLWAQKIDEYFAPAIEQINAVRLDMYDLNISACGVPWNIFSPPLDPTAMGPELELGDNPTTQQIAFTMGWSMGRPMAWLRSIQQSNSVLGLNFFVMLVYYLSAGLSWIVFVTVVTYSARLIRLAVAAAIKLYELIPFKAT